GRSGPGRASRDARAGARSRSRASRTRLGVWWSTWTPPYGLAHVLVGEPASTSPGHALCPPGVAGGEPRAATELAQHRRQHVGRHVELIDLGELLGEGARRQPEQHVRRQVAVDRDAGLLHVGARLLDRADAARLAVGRDLQRVALAFGALTRVGGFLRDQLLRAPGELGLVGELVLGDGALLLDRER